MARSFALATLIVAVALLVVVGLAPRRRAPGDSPSVTSSGTPSPPDGAAPEPSRAPEALRGVAPWALSAVPECFTQVAMARGSRAFVDRRLPAGQTAVPEGSIVRSGDCTVRRVGTTLELRRGDGLALTVPAVLRFATRGAAPWPQRAPRELLLVAQSGPTLVARRYRSAPDATIATPIAHP